MEKNTEKIITLFGNQDFMNNMTLIEQCLKHAGVKTHTYIKDSRFEDVEHDFTCMDYKATGTHIPSTIEIKIITNKDENENKNIIRGI